MIKYLKDHVFPKSISKKEATDTGMAMVLIMLLLGYFTGNDIYYKLAIPLLVLNMTFPMLYYPVAVLWLGLTLLLGSVISRVLLTIVYIVILFPIGLFRRLIGKDNLLLKGFKKGSGSVMITRDHSFTSNDIIHPY